MEQKTNFTQLINSLESLDDIKLYDVLKKSYKLLGIGDWGLGIGDWANPQSPIPNPQSPN